MKTHAAPHQIKSNVAAHWLLSGKQVTLAEYLADVLPESFKGNETAAEVDASPVWKDESHGWIHHSKVRMGWRTPPSRRALPPLTHQRTNAVPLRRVI